MRELYASGVYHPDSPNYNTTSVKQNFIAGKYAVMATGWFSYQGEFWSYRDVSLWPRPVQQPRPPIWMPIVGSKESIEFAAKHDLPITEAMPERPSEDQRASTAYKNPRVEHTHRHTTAAGREQIRQ